MPMNRNARQKKFITMLISLFMCCLSASLLAAAFATEHWFKSDIKDHEGSGKTYGDMYVGLFKGQRYTKGLVEFKHILHAVCLEGVCMYSCADKEWERKDHLRMVLNTGPNSTFNDKYCKNYAPQGKKSPERFQSVVHGAFRSSSLKREGGLFGLFSPPFNLDWSRIVNERMKGSEFFKFGFLKEYEEEHKNSEFLKVGEQDLKDDEQGVKDDEQAIKNSEFLKEGEQDAKNSEFLTEEDEQGIKNSDFLNDDKQAAKKSEFLKDVDERGLKISEAFPQDEKDAGNLENLPENEKNVKNSENQRAVDDFGDAIDEGVISGREEVEDLAEAEGSSPSPPIEVEADDLMNYGLWVSTIVFLSLGLTMAVVGALFAVINTAMTPVEAITGVPGLYLWNGLATLFDILCVVMWSVQFHTHLDKNVLLYDEPNGWTTEGMGVLGYSFWLVVVAIFVHVANIAIIFIGTYEPRVKAQMEAPETKGGNIMLY